MLPHSYELVLGLYWDVEELGVREKRGNERETKGKREKERGREEERKDYIFLTYMTCEWICSH